MTPFHHLHVLWKNEAESKIPIGYLQQTHDGFTFSYRGHDEIEALERAGFLKPAEFPHWRSQDDPYKSGYLFSTFAQRIPSPKRPDFKRIMEEWGVEKADDPMEVLGRSGGVLPNDALSVAEVLTSEDLRTRPIEFLVAGQKHYIGQNELKAGSRLVLKQNPHNPHDRV